MEANENQNLTQCFFFLQSLKVVHQQKSKNVFKAIFHGIVSMKVNVILNEQ